MTLFAAAAPYARVRLRLAGDRSIVRVLNDCQPVRILHMQYDKTMLLF